jgi:hypothetical protein
MALKPQNGREMKGLELSNPPFSPPVRRKPSGLSAEMSEITASARHLHGMIDAMK